VEDARSDAAAQVGAATRQVAELERQRDSVTTYLEEMRGVLGGVLPQAPASRSQQQSEAEEPASPASAPSPAPVSDSETATTEIEVVPATTASGPRKSTSPRKPAGSKKPAGARGR